MFGRKNAQQKRINELAADNAQLMLDKEGLDATARHYRNKYSDEARRNAHLTAEIHQLERDVARLLPDAEKYRRARANLIPGGPKAKAKRDALAALPH